jgi:DNA-binding CsgD family transcriptional regulator
MERLGPSDYQAVLGFMRQLYAVDRVDDFPRRAILGIGRLIPCDILTYNEIDTRRQRARMVEEPAGVIDDQEVATFEHHAHQHPLITHYAQTRDSRPRKISDFLSLSEFRRLGLYQEFFGKLPISYQMAVTIPSSRELVIGIAVNRSAHDFSERDRAVLDLMRPHLVQAYRNAAERATLRERAETAEQAMSSAPGRQLSCLTKRERDVLVLVAEGKTNPQIAEHLRLSSRTVQKHLEHVYEKLEVRSRTAAAMRLAAPNQPADERSEEATVAGRATR